MMSFRFVLRLDSKEGNSITDIKDNKSLFWRLIVGLRKTAEGKAKCVHSKAACVYTMKK